MNYAWSNPKNGVREQDDTLEGARLRLWQELQTVDAWLFPENKTPAHGDFDPGVETADTWLFPDNKTGKVWEQRAIGLIDTDHELPEQSLEDWTAYAWASPVNAVRFYSANWNIAGMTIRAQIAKSPDKRPVMVYLQRLACVVKRDDPKPQESTPQPAPAFGPSQVITAILDGSDMDFERATVLAQLWTAEALQKIADSMSPAPIKSVGPIGPLRAGPHQFWVGHFDNSNSRECGICGKLESDSIHTTRPDSPDAPLQTLSLENEDERRARIVRGRSQQARLASTVNSDSPDSKNTGPKAE